MNNTDNTPADVSNNPVEILVAVIVIAISSPILGAIIYTIFNKP